MKNKNLQDERILSQHRKVYSEAYFISIILLIISLGLQQLLFNASLEQYAAELICILIPAVYIIIRHIILGLDLYSDKQHKKRILLLYSLLAGFMVTILNGIRNYINYADVYKRNGIGYFIAVLFITFISAAALVFIILSCLNYLSIRKQEKIQKQFDENEQDN